MSCFTSYAEGGEVPPPAQLTNGMHWWPNPLLDEDEFPAWSWLYPNTETNQ